MNDLRQYALDLAERSRRAATLLATVSGAGKSRWLKSAAQALRERTEELLRANQLDLDKAPEFDLTSAAIDRLRLTPARIEGMAKGLEEVAQLPDPVGEVIEGSVRPNGLHVSRVRVPLGVVFFIYESRPNVTTDAASICVKSGNAVILRGGKESLHSNRALHALLSETLETAGLPRDAVLLVETTDRAAVGHFLALRDKIDVTIPRGGKSLIERVSAEATMPVIKHFDGICHVFVDASADFEMAERIILNSKCQRPGVCNAAESLLVHAAIANEFLPRVSRALRNAGVELRCCPQSLPLVEGGRRATDDDFRTEFLDLILAVGVVDDVSAAIAHVNKHGSHHTDAIVTGDVFAARRFRAEVDSAAVVVNASTRFNDGGELGLGAEIGISTDKFHARGPCGLRELTSYKWIVEGTGQIRE